MSRRLDLRRPLHLGAIATAAAAAVMVWSTARGSTDLTTFHDAKAFVAVAQHPFDHGGDHVLTFLVGRPYRCGRIGFPLLAWLIAGGRPGSVPFALAVVFALSVGALVAAAAALARDARAGLLVFASPFTLVWLVHPMLVGDPLALAAALAAYLAERRKAPALAVVLATFAVLSRESMVLAIAPLAARQIRATGRPAIRRWALGAATVGGWYVVVAARTGWLPFLDPTPSRRYATASPFAGIAKVVQLGPDAGQWFAIVVGAATVVLAGALAVRRRPTAPLVLAALLLAAGIPFLGPLVWGVPEDAQRVLWAVQVLCVVAATSVPARPRLRLQRPGSLGASSRRDDPVPLAS